MNFFFYQKLAHEVQGNDVKGIGWRFLALLLFIYGFHLLLIHHSNTFIASRYMVKSGHDWSNFYYGKSLVSALKNTEKNDHFWPNVEERLKKDRFIIEGKPGHVLFRALLFAMVGDDFSLAESPYNNGENASAFKREYYIYIILHFLCAVLVFKVGTLCYGVRAGRIASVLFAISTASAFFITWKIYIVPSTFSLLAAVYYHLKSRQDNNLYLWVSGLLYGVTLFINPRVITFMMFIPLLHLFFYKKGNGLTVELVKIMSIFTGAFGILITYDVIILHLFYSPDLYVEESFGERSWLFFKDSYLYSLVDSFAHTRPGFVRYNWPLYFPIYLWNVEGILLGTTLIVILAGSAVNVSRIIYQRLMDNVFTQTDRPSIEVAEFGHVYMLMLGPVYAISLSVLSLVTYTAYTGRGFFPAYLGLLFLTGRWLDILYSKWIKMNRWLPASYVHVIIGLLLCYQFGNVVNMYRILNSPAIMAKWLGSVEPYSVAVIGGGTSLNTPNLQYQFNSHAEYLANQFRLTPPPRYLISRQRIIDAGPPWAVFSRPINNNPWIFMNQDTVQKKIFQEPGSFSDRQAVGYVYLLNGEWKGAATLFSWMKDYTLTAYHLLDLMYLH